MREWFHGLKLNQKIMLVTLACVFVPTLFLSLVSFWGLRENAIDRAIGDAATEAELMCADINSKAETCRTLADAIRNYNPMQNYLVQLRTGVEISDTEYQQFRSTTISLIERMQDSNSDIYRIRIYAESDDFLEQYPILLQKNKMSSCVWAEHYQSQGDWFYNQLDTAGMEDTGSWQPERLMVYVCDLKDSVGEKVGVLEISMRMESVFPEIYRSDHTKWTGFISDTNQIYDCQKSKAACKWQEYRGIILFRSDIKKHEDKQFSCVIGKENVVLVTRKIQELGGMIITLTNINEATGELEEKQNRMIFFLIVSGILLILVVNIVIRSLLKEFYDMLTNIREINDGSSKIRIPHYNTEEMREMGYSVNWMLERIQKQTEESIQRESLLKDTAIKAMQNQINAHFIYNVLESVKMMAEIDGEYTISDAVTSLGEMLHYNMRWKTFLVTVRDEMEYIENYVELMNLRYDFTITLAVKIPDLILQQDIPKMSLQPVVENAITHGIEELDEDATIYIKGVLKADSFDIEIQDSGKGMSERTLQKLRRKLQSHVNTDEDQRHGIGLKNVQDRIHIQFGMQYGLLVDSREGCFTKVTIHLPLTRGSFLVEQIKGEDEKE